MGDGEVLASVSDAKGDGCRQTYQLVSIPMTETNVCTSGKVIPVSRILQKSMPDKKHIDRRNETSHIGIVRSLKPSNKALDSHVDVEPPHLLRRSLVLCGPCGDLSLDVDEALEKMAVDEDVAGNNADPVDSPGRPGEEPLFGRAEEILYGAIGDVIKWGRLEVKILTYLTTVIMKRMKNQHEYEVLLVVEWVMVMCGIEPESHVWYIDRRHRRQKLYWIEELSPRYGQG